MADELRHPEDLRYNESHEWARCKDNIVTVGISDHAQAELQNVVYVELPEVGFTTKQKEEFGVIESVKAAYDLYAPVSGEIIEINEELEYTPELVNEDPYNQGWMIKIRMDDSNELDNLLSAEDYFTYIESKEMGE
ncbi:TPA: glycine cleavage system protein GcvH [Candidatus Poribacteria bacterium]|nr:glycine cleavage system protein GcvH [Candidatus Poribacteria bacterium]HIO05479.1 glycine cleavage system protein GcvH [Candidatus Poribacteria bacterium]HIO50279.1 glycine cleavage system protein GcvH [Candidatus Poribacteria bacterium]